MSLSHSYIWMDIGMCIALNTVLSPMLAFALYFALHHALAHVWRVRRSAGRTGVQGALGTVLAWMASLATFLALAVGLGRHDGGVAPSASGLHALIVLLAALTLPHAFGVHAWWHGARFAIIETTSNMRKK